VPGSIPQGFFCSSTESMTKDC